MNVCRLFATVSCSSDFLSFVCVSERGLVPDANPCEFCMFFTDLPSIFSGNGIGFLDPHEMFFRREGRYPTSSYLWNLKEDREKITELEDQFAPFWQDLIGTAKEKTLYTGYFHGTVFRFPLRTEGMHSDLCTTNYTAEKVRGLFSSLESDSHIMLLFLKNIEKIEVFEKKDCNSAPVNILTIEIAPDSLPTVSDRRRQLISDIDQRRSGSRQESTSVVFKMTTSMTKAHLSESAASNNSPELKTWIVSHYYGSHEETRAISESSESSRTRC